jgi:hypothetical protein
MFRIGDIVEVQTTVSVVQVKKERFRMVVNLRAMAMLDSSPSIVSGFLRSVRRKRITGMWLQKADSHRLKTMAGNSRIREPTFRAPIKRKVGYADCNNEIAETRRKVLSMAICNQNEEDDE